MITRHPGGFWEIHVDNQGLILTPQEYFQAVRRYESVWHNRWLAENRKKGVRDDRQS